MGRKLRDSVVVVTGASSGIGRATALKFAAKGAAVVLAARRDAVLREVERECLARGGRALVVPTDVTEESQLRTLAQRAIDAFGRIDVWVNNAAVTMFGRFEESPIEDYEQVIRTNLLGYVYGARAVLPHFRERGQGVLINVASVAGALAQPYTSAYGVSQYGIRGLTEGLRMELMDTPRIHACTVMPASIDTPLFQHAANFTGREIRAMEPVYPAEQVARAIVSLARRPRREVVVGAAGRAMLFNKRWLPGLTERMMARQVERTHLTLVPAEDTHGNLFRPMAEGTGISGGWRQQALPRNGGMRLLQGLGLLAVPLGLYYLWSRRQRGTSRWTSRAPQFARGALLAGVPLVGTRLRRRPWPALGRQSSLAAAIRSIPSWFGLGSARSRFGTPLQRLGAGRGSGRALPGRREVAQWLAKAPDRRQLRQWPRRFPSIEQVQATLQRGLRLARDRSLQVAQNPSSPFTARPDRWLSQAWRR